jgi:SAM-dependent methyltransferase
MGSEREADWAAYLSVFHTEQPGITERVLRRARCAAGDPYDWLGAAVPGTGRVLDVACGSAPLWSHLAGRAYLGVDLSAAELALARQRGAGPLLRASATAVPVADETVDTVVCAMALHVIQPLPAVFAEIGRVLVPGGRLAALVPDRGPLRGADPLWLAGLMAALGRTIGYPGDTALRHGLPQLLGAAELHLVDDRRRRFTYRLRTPEDADLLLSSLYLPGLPERRLRVARRWLHTLARAHAKLPVPLRRILAMRS